MLPTGFPPASPYPALRPSALGAWQRGRPLQAPAAPALQPVCPTTPRGTGRSRGRRAASSVPARRSRSLSEQDVASVLAFPECVPVMLHGTRNPGAPARFRSAFRVPSTPFLQVPTKSRCPAAARVEEEGLQLQKCAFCPTQRMVRGFYDKKEIWSPPQQASRDPTEINWDERTREG
jgi:hypothetical protein